MDAIKDDDVVLLFVTLVFLCIFVLSSHVFRFLSFYAFIVVLA